MNLNDKDEVDDFGRSKREKWNPTQVAYFNYLHREVLLCQYNICNILKKSERPLSELELRESMLFSLLTFEYSFKQLVETKVIKRSIVRIVKNVDSKPEHKYWV